MTPEEKRLLQQRISQAETIERTVAQLDEALKSITTGKARRLNVALRENSDPIHFSEEEKPDCRWSRLCWAQAHEGLAAEIGAAVQAILERRMLAAKQQLEAV